MEGRRRKKVRGKGEGGMQTEREVSQAEEQGN